MEQNTRHFLTDDEIRDKVALRAFEIYQDRGGQHGRDIDDWLQAETDVLSGIEEQQKSFSIRKQPPTTRSAGASQRAAKTKRTVDPAG